MVCLASFWNANNQKLLWIIDSLYQSDKIIGDPIRWNGRISFVDHTKFASSNNNWWCKLKRVGNFSKKIRKTNIRRGKRKSNEKKEIKSTISLIKWITSWLKWESIAIDIIRIQSITYP